MNNKYIVTGKVQGVWFRESTRQLALKLGVMGHAINLPDGSVEVLAQGDGNALIELETWLRKGPPMARVDNVQVSDDSREPVNVFQTA